MKTLRVQWAEGAIEQAVQRLTTIVNETSTDATHTIVGRPLSWMDLACLLDFVRQCDGDHAPVYKKLLALVPDKEWDAEPPTLGEVVDAVLAKVQGAPEVETQGLSHALLLKGYRGFADQVDAMGRRIREQDEELALHREREALTRKALQLDDTWVVQLGALAVRQERDRLRKQVGLTVDCWKPGDIVLDSTDFAWQRFETGWRTVPRDRGVQYEDEQLESLAGPLVRLAAVPDVVDELGMVPAAVAQQLREEACRVR